MNNSSTAQTHRYNGVPHNVQMIILTFILIECLCGNLLVLITIICTNSLRSSLNCLIMNLAVCDMMIVIGGIPFTTILYNIYHGPENYPFGVIGCKTLWPFTTYAHNCSAFTLAVIAVERFVNISFVYIKFTKRTMLIVMIAIHILAVVVVIPYINTLKLMTHGNNKYCYEQWDERWQRAYTISLFIIQFSLPLLIMAILYFLAWRKLYMTNNIMIKMSEEYEKKMAWRKSYPLARKTSESTQSSKISETDSMSIKSFRKSIFSTRGKEISSRQSKYQYSEMKEVCKGSKNIHRSYEVEVDIDTTTVISRRSLRETSFSDKKERNMYNHQSSKEATPNGSLSSKLSSVSQSSRGKPKKRLYASQISHDRHKQSRSVLKMFTVVMAVFASCSLPIQVSWFAHNLSPVVADIFMLLSYVSPAVNCWIYGGFHSTIRKAYSRIFCCLCKTKVVKKVYSAPATPYPPFEPNTDEELLRRRMSSFDHMFDDYIETHKHLCKEIDIEEEEVSGNFIDESIEEDKREGNES